MGIAADQEKIKRKVTSHGHYTRPGGPHGEYLLDKRENLEFSWVLRGLEAPWPLPFVREGDVYFSFAFEASLGAESRRAANQDKDKKLFPPSRCTGGGQQWVFWPDN